MIYPNGTQDFGLSGTPWNNGYFNNVYAGNLHMKSIDTGLTREIGKTCTIAGYFTVKVDGVKRKVPYCR